MWRTVLASFWQRQGRWKTVFTVFMWFPHHVLAAAATIFHIPTTRRTPWFAVSSQQSPLNPQPVRGAFLKWFGKMPVNVWHHWSCHSWTTRVCPEVFWAKCGPAAWMNFPLVERENWQSCPLMWRTGESGAGSASAIFQSYIIMERLIIAAVKHTVCWLYQFCQEMGKRVTLQLPAAVSHIAMTSQFSLQGCASQVGQRLRIRCALLSHPPSALTQPAQRQHKACSCQAGKGRFNLSHGKWILPYVAHTQWSWGKGSSAPWQTHAWVIGGQAQLCHGQLE